MIRIYLDSNVFRMLKNSDLNKYKDIKEHLLNYKDRYIYFYSRAHLLDLKRDNSNIKYDDLNLMEKFVDDNYLSFGAGNECAHLLLQKPLDAFNEIEDEMPLIEYFNFDNYIRDENGGIYPELIDKVADLELLMNTSINLNLESNISSLSQEDQNLWKSLLPNVKDNYTFKEFFEMISSIYESLFNDPKFYKDLRRYTVELLSLTQKYNIDINSINFNEDLKNTPIQQSFFDFVNKSIENNSKIDNSPYSFFISAYHILNVLGLDKEPNKKAKFASTFNDALHSYFSSHCDYLISDDQGLLIKSKVLFKLLGIETKVLQIEDFVSQTRSIEPVFDNSIEIYFKRLTYDLKHGLVINTKPSIRYQRSYTTVKPSQLYFFYFNLFDIINDDENGTFIVFYRETNNNSNYTYIKEVENVTNKVVNLFGVDNNLLGSFSDLDMKTIKEGDWVGRKWVIGEIVYRLEINEGTRKFNFSISLPENY